MDESTRDWTLAARIIDASDPVFALDRDGVCRFANRAARALTDPDPDPDPGSLEGAPVFERVPLFADPRARAAWTAALEGDEPVETEAALPGTGRRFRLRFVPGTPETVVFVRETANGHGAAEAAEALRASEERFRRIIEGVDAIVAYQEDADSPVLHSPQVERILGYRPDELWERDAWAPLVHPDDRQACQKIWDSEEDSRLMHYRMVRKDGRVIWVADRGRRIHHADGRGPGLFGIVTDVTETEEAREAARRADARSRRLYEADIIGSALSRVEGLVLEANDYLLRLIGRDRRALERGEIDWRVVSAPSSEPADERALDQVRERGSSEPYEKEYIRPDGSRVPALIVLASVPGSETDIASFVLDMSSQRAAAADIARLAAAIEQTSESVVITDPDANIVYVNPAFERVSGYARDEVMGRNPRVMQSGRHDREFYRAMWSILGAGETWQGDLQNRRKDGSIYTEVASISPVRDASGAVSSFVAVKRDVTLERELEAERAHAARIGAIGRLAGGVAHDFNNLLTAISGYGDLVNSALPAGSAAKRDMAEILLAADRAAALTHQLLAFSRRQALDPRVLDVQAVIGDLLPMLRPLLGAHIDIVASHAGGPAFVRVDRVSLEQVIVNLAVNARDAMPRGGRLALVTSSAPASTGTPAVPEPSAAAAAVAGSGPAPGWVRLTVTDTGVGMDPETANHIFEPFYTTKGVGMGTGMGLATVHGIIQASGGRISVASAEGSGSTFTIDLPLAVGASEAATSSRPSSPVARAGEHVLVVEDEPSLRALVQRMLEGLGYFVVTAASGAEALEVARERTRPFNLLVTDVRMPGMLGTDLASRMRERWPELPVVLATGFAEGLDIDAERIRARLLNKPFDLPALAGVVREALDSTG